jgi:predicted alpha/beta-fold hydrolase
VDASDAFSPAWWLPGPHAQTVWGRLTRPRKWISYRREVLETPDGDDLVIDHVDGPGGSPIVVVMHGLEGSSYSVYVQGILALSARRGWRGAAMNFRSCARDPGNLSRMLPNRRPRLYHSGETEDLGFLVRTLAAREPGAPILAVGASLGGNVLVKWLGENPSQTVVRAATAISVPFDLGAGARYLEKGIGPWYAASFLATLKPKALAAVRRFPEAAAKIDIERTQRSKTFREFDDAANAPLHGFAGADDYYRRASSLGYLSAISTPTLCISAQDDPFLPRECLDRARAGASAAVEFARTGVGGHIGFVSGASPWRPRFWAEETAVEYLARNLF